MKIKGKFTVYYKQGKIHEIELSAEDLKSQLKAQDWIPCKDCGLTENMDKIYTNERLEPKPTEPERCEHEWLALRPTDISEYRTKVYCKFCCETKFIN